MIKLFTKKRKGFTLIELVVVIAILGILAAIAIPRFAVTQENAKRSADRATARTIVSAVNMAAASGDVSIDYSEETIKTNKIIEANSALGIVNDIPVGTPVTPTILYQMGYLDEPKNTQLDSTKGFNLYVDDGALKVRVGSDGEILHPAND